MMPQNRMMQELYGSKRNTFGYNEFNKTHIHLSGQVRAIFKEARDILCDFCSLSDKWSWPDKRWNEISSQMFCGPPGSTELLTVEEIPAI